MERDRESTEKRLIDTIGQMIAQNGFEKIGINAVSAQSGVSKILIYRYFGSLDGLMMAYISKHDFWLNFEFDIPEGGDALPIVKDMFRKYVAQLRTDAVLRRLFRWELTCSNEIIGQLREKRERAGVEMIRRVSGLKGRAEQEGAVVATLITAATTYLAILSDTCAVFNGLDLNSDSGWDTISNGVENLIDSVFAK